MQIDDKLIDKMESLAFLRFAAEERPALLADLEAVFAELNWLPSDVGGEEMVYPYPMTNVFREDEAIKFVSRERLMAGAPETFTPSALLQGDWADIESAPTEEDESPLSALPTSPLWQGGQGAADLFYVAPATFE